MELDDRTKELIDAFRSTGASLAGMGYDVRDALNRFNAYERTRDYSRIERRLHLRDTLDARMERYEEMARRMEKLAGADSFMRANPGMFNTTAQAMHYQDRMRQIIDPLSVRREQMERLYGADGSQAISNAEKNERFRRDTLSDYDREFESLKERYNGDTDMADRRMRHEALKNLPDFFKNSKMSVSSLRMISEGVGKIPVFSNMLRTFKKGQSVGEKDSVAGTSVLLTGALGLAIEGLKKIINVSKEQATTQATANRSGLPGSSYVAMGAVLGATGGDGGSIGNLIQKWKSNVGGMLTGGGSEFIANLAKYGIDVSGASGKGIMDESEYISRVAEKIREFAKAGDPRGIALADQEGWDKSMYDLALRHGGGIVKALSNYMFKHAAENIQSGHENAYDISLGQQYGSLAAQGYVRKAYTGVRDFTPGGDGKPIGTREEIENPAGRSLRINQELEEIRQRIRMKETGKQIREMMENSKGAEEAALSLDQYEKNGVVGGGGGLIHKTNSVAFNISQLTVPANNPQELMEGLQQTAAQYGGRPVVEAMDLKVVA